MPFSFSLFVASFVSFQCICFVSSCGSDQMCPDKPVFTPSSLVVKYGDPAYATCVVCQSGCNEDVSNLEKSSGTTEKNGRTIMWNVSSLTEWDSDLICFNENQNGTQCCTTLGVTVYQTPKDVSFRVFNHSGPMLENSLYALVCDVQDVAPVGKLVVTFYRGLTQLKRLQLSTRIEKKPLNVTFLLSYEASREDDGAQLSCGAKLELGPEGPQHLSVVKSQNVTATIHYGPDLLVTVNPDPITVEEGGILCLNCSAVGNPAPSYTWTLPFSGPHFSSSVLTIKPASSQHEGQYNCTVSNSIKTVSVLFDVKVQGLEVTSSAPTKPDPSLTSASSTMTTPGPKSDATTEFSLWIHQILLCSVIFVSFLA
ncbi:Vascular cell adhesion protein 1 [Oryzias melastigma]|uniref:Vascular cell adhesion protein 1 n=1 Tax=Oryzias melastigma TaxID=30732 RepID=A0A834FMF2_ORYME|nr:Vascular cell adhesion protein 1 [Oryzias melastigma]